MTEYVKSFDIICLGETKLSKIPANEFSSYDIFSLKQKSSLHGLAVLVKNGLFNYTQKLKLKSKCVLWVALGASINNISFVIGAVYIPGDCSKFADPYDFEVICEDILTLKNKFNCPLIAMGDFNARSGKLNDFEDLSELDIQLKGQLEKIGITTDRFSLDKKIDTYGRNLIKMCNDSDLKIVNGRFGSDRSVGNFTCHKPRGESVVDYCLMSNSLLHCISNFYVDTFDRCMSDVHSPICLEIKIPQADAASLTFSDQRFEKIPFKSSWKPELKEPYKNAFSENEILQLSEKVLNAHLSSDLSKIDLEHLVSDLTSVILKPAKSLGLCKKVGKKCNKSRKSPKQSWFNEKCEEKRKLFFKSKNAMRKATTVEEKKLCQDIIDQKGKEYKLFIAKHQKLFNKQFHKHLRELHRHNPKEYWNLLKTTDSSQKNEPQIPLSEFESFFRNLNQDSSSTQTPEFDASEIDPSVIEEFNLEFTMEEIQKNIHSLKNNKSEGGDYIKNEFLKNLPLSLVELIVKLFNLILRTGHVPEEWGVGLIVPIFKKKGSKTDPNNYRGITLLSCLGKLFTLCLNNRLATFATNRNIIGEEQAAFREGYSTIDHAFVLNELINMYLQNGKKKRLYCCFIDYQKAFDTIRRSLLWSKMIRNGINGKILRVIYNMYQSAKSCVKQKSMKSGLFTCNMGV